MLLMSNSSMKRTKSKFLGKDNIKILILPETYFTNATGDSQPTRHRQ